MMKWRGKELPPNKRERLREDIRKGLESGEPTPWNAEEIKREGK